MSAALYDMVKMTVTNTPLTGTITLGSAVAGFQSFAAASVPDQMTVTYAGSEGTTWELRRGVYTVSSTTLTRGALLGSSTGSAISFSSAMIVRIVVTAEDLQPAPATGLTANANNLQSTTSIIGANQNYFTTVTATNNSTKIPAAMMIPGCPPIYIKNKTGAAVLNVFGDTGVQIDLLGANASYGIGVHANVAFLVENATQLHSVG